MKTRDQVPIEQPDWARRSGGHGLTAVFCSRTFESLGIRDYRWLWLSSMAGFMAMQMQMVARGWLVYDLTESPMALAWVMVSMALPMSVFTLVGGAITDRVSKRLLIGGTMIVSAIITGLIALLIHFGQIAFWHLLLTGALNGIVLSFQMPGRFSFVPQVVGEDRLVNAISLSNLGMNLSRVLAPAVAGVLIGAVGVAGVFDAMAGLYALGAAAVFVMHHRGDPETSSHRGVTFDIVAGLNYVRGNTIVMALLVMALIPMLFGMPYMLLLPAFAVEALDLGAKGLGLLLAISGVGAIVGSLMVAYLGNFKHMGALLFGSAVLWGVMLAGMSQGTTLAMVAVPLALTGLVSAVFMSVNVSMIQLHAVSEMRGRVMSIFMWTFSLMPLGLLPVSFAAERSTTATAFLGSAVLLVLATTAVFALVPQLRRLRPTVDDGKAVQTSGGARRPGG